MSKNTAKTLRNQTVYQVYVRNFSKEGTFKEVTGSIARIKKLGVDVVWFAPIHPIGETKRKGKLGSPYAIKDYRSINPEYGTIDDFKETADAIHAAGMKCIIDVVYNHTSPDSVLACSHPEWFYHKSDGSFGNHVGDWSDIIDLDYSEKGLWDYQIETLKMWAEIVDGFRCDVASLIPVEFWLQARAEVEKVRPGCLWLSESVDPPFIMAMRELGLVAQSDSELYQAFDILYDYDIYSYLTEYLSGSGSLKSFSDAINRQEYTYPDNYVKLRFLENHDQPRARFLFPGEKALRNATSFLYFQKGMTLIYAGQEYGLAHLPNLFEKDPVDWNSKEKYDLTDLMKRLYDIKQDPLFADSTYRTGTYKEDCIMAVHSRGSRKIIGIFSLKGTPGIIPADMDDGRYINLIDGSEVEIRHGYISLNGEPVIIDSEIRKTV